MKVIFCFKFKEGILKFRRNAVCIKVIYYFVEYPRSTYLLDILFLKQLQTWQRFTSCNINIFYEGRRETDPKNIV